MGKIEKFEDLECWQMAKSLVLEVYKIVRIIEQKKDFGFADQYRRAVISIMNNIAEGFARFSKKEFKRFLEISNASCSEVKSMTYLLQDLDYANEIQVQSLFQSINQTQSKILGLIRYLNIQIDNEK